MTTSQEKDDLLETLRLKVYIERKKAGLTQKACAQKMGIPESSWSLAESGNTRPSLARLLQMLLVANPKAAAEAVQMIAASGSSDRRF